ncbi:MAG: zinc ribbon domain-containing protein [Chloroflexota bacterium]|nr:zinc ribbon domain-containing protein [Chloroflexota bacterium]
MSTYYEILKVVPTATGKDVERAIEEQYNQWRRLVTHHDPGVATQATQALQTLELIRSTLTDSHRRSAYDAGIGLGGPVGGLADPATLLQNTAVSPPRPNQQPRSDSGAQPKLWACYKCSAENPPQTKYCLNCGTQLVRKCPECAAEASLVASGMCGNCGYGYDIANRRAQLRQQVGDYEKELSQLKQNLYRIEHGDSSTEPANVAYDRPKPLHPLSVVVPATSLGMFLLLAGLTSPERVGALIAAVMILIFAALSYPFLKKQHEREVHQLAEEVAQTERECTTISRQINHLEAQVQQHREELAATQLT